MGIDAVIGLAAGAVVLAIVINAIVRAKTGKSEPKIDELQAKVDEKLNALGQKLEDLVKGK